MESTSLIKTGATLITVAYADRKVVEPGMRSRLAVQVRHCQGRPHSDGIMSR
jgi:hypothetical protein